MSCLDENTRVQMADGSARKISEIRLGDRVQEPMGGTLTVENIFRGTEDCLLRIEDEGGHQILLTDSHPVLTDQGWKRAGDLVPGSKAETNEGWAGIVKVSKAEGQSNVYNLELSADYGGCFIAEGFVVGDFKYQNSLR